MGHITTKNLIKTPFKYLPNTSPNHARTWGKHIVLDPEELRSNGEKYVLVMAKKRSRGDFCLRLLHMYRERDRYVLSIHTPTQS